MSRVGLTEKEEKHILLLLEGDVSDIELEESDEEDFDENDAFQQTAEVDEDSISQHVTLPNQNISFELEDDLDFDLEDDIPLARLLPVESSSKYARKKILSGKKMTSVSFLHSVILQLQVQRV